MNKTNWIQTGGVPLKAERLDEMQKSYSIFNALGNIGGNLCIVKGCEDLGTTVTAGVVYIEGELYDFKAGTKTTKVVITAEPQAAQEFKDGSQHVMHTKYFAEFAIDSAPGYEWNTFVRLDPIAVLMARLSELEKKTAVFQTGGGMVLWNKPAAEIPAGWQEVVNWRGRLPVGVDPDQVEYNTLGKAEGIKKKTLAISELPVINPVVDSAFRKGGNLGGGVGLTRNDNDGGPFAPGELIKPFGGGMSFSILNPYRTVYFIEYID